ISRLQLLHVVRGQLRRIERNRQLVDLAGKVERHLIVAVIHRRRPADADAEPLVDRPDQGNGPVQLLGGHGLAVHLQRPSATPANTAQVVVRQRRLTEPVVFEIELDRVLAGGQRLRSINYYNLNAEAYFADTVQADVHDLRSVFLSHVPAG